MPRKKFNINSLDLNLDFDLDFEGLEFSDLSIADNFDTRYIKPKLDKEIELKNLKFQYAVDLAKQITLDKNERIFAIVNGSFIFGDFLEALLVSKNVRAEQIIISSLSLNEDNIDSLALLMEKNYIGELNLILSQYFYAHERNGIIKYLYERLDFDNRFQVAFAGTHCKMILFETTNHHYIVIHGSANLRSSAALEQIMIENNKELYDFNYQYQMEIIDKYKTINKSIYGRKLWQVVQKK